MKILLTGRDGQVGWELERSLAPLGELLATDRASLDLSSPDAIRRVLREAKPGLIVNAAAYTAVERAESEPELATRINGVAPGILAEEAKRLGALLVHYSTDYVFDGEKGAPYREQDAPNPINAYGRSKLEGERAIAAGGGRWLVFRTSWVYGSRGRNFLLAILQRARAGGPLRVVDDQRGSPTWCREIASATAQIVSRAAPEAQGMYHLCAAGEATWHAFAVAILELAGAAVEVERITSAEYPTAAARPRCSVLACSKLANDFGVALLPWREALRRCLSGCALPSELQT